jgi:HNH endonuclease
MEYIQDRRLVKRILKYGRTPVFRNEKLKDYIMDTNGLMYKIEKYDGHKLNSNMEVQRYSEINIKRLSTWCNPNSKNKGNHYPQVKLRMGYKDYLTVHLHQIVAETWIPFNIPNGVTEKEWKRTPKSVQNIVKERTHVNHKDHNKQNFHPSNLEWVSAKENAQKAQEHYKKPEKKSEKKYMQMFDI